MGIFPHFFITIYMTILEQRFMEQVPKELHQLNENMNTIINLLKSKDSGTNT